MRNITRSRSPILSLSLSQTERKNDVLRKPEDILFSKSPLAFPEIRYDARKIVRAEFRPKHIQKVQLRISHLPHECACGKMRFATRSNHYIDIRQKSARKEIMKRVGRHNLRRIALPRVLDSANNIPYPVIRKTDRAKIFFPIFCFFLKSENFFAQAGRKHLAPLPYCSKTDIQFREFF